LVNHGGTTKVILIDPYDLSFASEENSMHADVNLLEQARALRPLVEAEASAADEALTMTAPMVEAFEKSGLFHIMVPKELGGHEADCSTIMDVFEELCHQDGSIGWSQMANASATSYCAFLEPEAAREMVGAKAGAVFAGQFAPRGAIRREGEGFRLSGDYGFGSGSGHASYLGGGGMVMGDDGNPEMLPSGMPAYLCYFIPKDAAVMKDGWDTLGLRGTGSFDYAVPEQFVDIKYSFWLFDHSVKTGGPFYGLGATALAGLGHAGWGLGVARRSLDEIGKIATAGRARMGSLPVADQQIFQREFGEKTFALNAVRALVHEVYGRMERRLHAGEKLEKRDNDEMMGAVAYMTQVCEEISIWAYRFAGSQGLRNPSLVQRAFRDMLTGGLHVFVDRKSYDEHAKNLLGLNG
jgi:alkylation response protein AidB-like acyl-CoA dehydrogenase